MSVGKAPFSLSGDDSRIYFGRDPQVTAVMKRNSQQSGKQGIIDRKQTYTWDWDITVFNKHSRPVAAMPTRTPGQVSRMAAAARP